MRMTAKLTNFQGMLTTSTRMKSFFEDLRRVSRTDASVLLRGETGTGKELAARAIHTLSPRKASGFRAVNCATFTPELLASKLFGHERGAFTGAVKSRQGLFALANRGTLFLDEVAEIPLEIQARLLRVLQEQTFVPLGGTDPIQVDVRIVSATHRALRAEVDAKTFREDLMYRIRVVPLYIPKLIERDGDVEALTWYFIRHFNTQGYRHVKALCPHARDALLSYSWPGNIRELRNVIEYAFAIGEGETLTVNELTPELRGEAPAKAPSDQVLTLAEMERERLIDALRQAGGRRGPAADKLGMSRSTLWRKLREHGLQ